MTTRKREEKPRKSCGERVGFSRKSQEKSAENRASKNEKQEYTITKFNRNRQKLLLMKRTDRGRNRHLQADQGEFEEGSKKLVRYDERSHEREPLSHSLSITAGDLTFFLRGVAHEHEESPGIRSLSPLPLPVEENRRAAAFSFRISGCF
ncbi:hypothetical protein [Allobaculum sp. Allo2]|uniref:hypothetical protein n=1 Tax=Allobaculum sp. Allo2 TaxID=2853432 RepID=UPI001F61BFF8|nr:hypothetical protein [Allobaculum sp. Allo2]UNT94144.1 hypothetical protein KWG61_05785 [Allobaculum sp. Allo2]